MFHAYGYDPIPKGSDPSVKQVNRLAHWNQIYKSSGYKPEKLADKPTLEPNLVYLWDLYITIKNGCDDLTYTVIASYMGLSGIDLTPWEVSILIDIEVLRKNE